MKKSAKLESFGNATTMNMNDILFQNIRSSQYTKQLEGLTTYDEVIQEIQRKVTHLEPFIGNTTNASTAFCLLYKLWTLRLTVAQMEHVIQDDSAFIRCLGFLYLRYTYPLAKIMEWFEDFLEDDQPIKVRAGLHAPQTTVGRFVRDLLLNKKYFTTMLPTIPIPVMRDIEPVVRETGKNERDETDRGRPRSRSISRSPEDPYRARAQRRRYASRSPSPISSFSSRDRSPRDRRRSRSPRVRSRERRDDRRRRSRSRDRRAGRDRRSRSGDRDRSRRVRSRSRSRSRDRRDSRRERNRHR
eukprot:Lithocolla_globosa_v1_NODE_4872_length_1348_cov_16.268368.p1 type:complete len:300 gc:universal NODE_4872_length_1348_cov_16.268368:904-5(-)